MSELPVRYGHCLVSLKSYIGDCVMGLPTFRAIEDRFERVTYLAGGAIPQVLWMPDRERRVVTGERCKTPSAVRREAAWMKSENFDAVLLVNHSFRSAITVKMAGIPVRVGHRTELRSMFLTHAVAYDETEFEAVSTSHLAAAIGISVPDQIPTMPISDDERVRGNHFRDSATVGIQPGARFGAKQIPISVTIEIALSSRRERRRGICRGAHRGNDRSTGEFGGKNGNPRLARYVSKSESDDWKRYWIDAHGGGGWLPLHHGFWPNAPRKVGPSVPASPGPPGRGRDDGKHFGRSRSRSRSTAVAGIANEAIVPDRRD